MGVTPPLTGVAVKVTLTPEQIVFPGLAAILRLDATFDVTVIVMEFDVDGEPVMHVALETITQVMRSPFASVVMV